MTYIQLSLLQSSERVAATRHGALFSSAGYPMFENVVDGAVVYLRVRPYTFDFEDRRLRSLHNGIRIDVEKMPVNYLSWHLKLSKVRQLYL